MSVSFRVQEQLVDTWDQILGGFHDPLCSQWTQSHSCCFPLTDDWLKSGAVGSVGLTNGPKLQGGSAILAPGEVFLPKSEGNGELEGALPQRDPPASECLQGGEHILGMFLKGLLLCVVCWTRMTSRIHSNARHF